MHLCIKVWKFLRKHSHARQTMSFGKLLIELLTWPSKKIANTVNGQFWLTIRALWLRKSGSSTCLLYKEGNLEDIFDRFVLFHFLFACLNFKDKWATFWHILKEKVSNSDYLEKNILLHFIENLDKPTTARLLFGSLSWPISSRIADFLNKFVAASIRKIYSIRQNMIREVS